MAETKFVAIRNDPNRVVLGGRFEIEDEFLHSVFSGIPATEYDDFFKRALIIGAYALKEERIAAFLGTVESELDGRLEELKMLHKVRTLKARATTKGTEAEADIGSELQDFIDANGWPDLVVRTGEKVGALPRRKVGDLVASIPGSTKSIVIESKWDKSIQLGDPVKSLTNPEKTAYGQNLTALINRESEMAIFVTTRSVTHSSILRDNDGIRFHPEIPGFIATVDSDTGDWTNLKVAYAIARSMALATDGSSELTDRTLMVVKRLIRDLGDVLDISKQLTKITDASASINTAVESIRTLMDSSLSSAAHSEAMLTRVLAGDSIPDIEWKNFYDESNSGT